MKNLQGTLKVFINNLDFVHDTEMLKEDLNKKLLEKYYERIKTHNQQITEEYRQCMSEENHNKCVKPVNKSLPYISDQLSELNDMLIKK